MTPLSATLLAAVAVGLAATPLAMVNIAGLGSAAARVMTGLTEPGALLVWGTVLAGLARACGRRPHQR